LESKRLTADAVKILKEIVPEPGEHKTLKVGSTCPDGISAEVTISRIWRNHLKVLEVSYWNEVEDGQTFYLERTLLLDGLNSNRCSLISYRETAIGNSTEVIIRDTDAEVDRGRVDSEYAVERVDKLLQRINDERIDAGKLR